MPDEFDDDLNFDSGSQMEMTKGDNVDDMSQANFG
jgi:hypothetical protein